MFLQSPKDTPKQGPQLNNHGQANFELTQEIFHQRPKEKCWEVVLNIFHAN